MIGVMTYEQADFLIAPELGLAVYPAKSEAGKLYVSLG